MKSRIHVGSMLLGIALGAVALTAALTLPAAHAQSAIADGTPIDQEPLLIYDVSGFGFGGPIHKHLTVYSNGLCTVSGGSDSFGPSVADFRTVDRKRVRVLHRDLIDSGALLGVDRIAQVADLPLTTVTVFESSERNASHNTYSFFDVSGGEAGVVGLIREFIEETFPEFAY